MFSIRISPLTPEMLAYAEQGAPRRQALISIMDHKRDALERYPAERVLRLCFDDAVDSSFYQNLITMEQAEAIRDFVLRYQNEIDVLRCRTELAVQISIALVTLGAIYGMMKSGAMTLKAEIEQERAEVRRAHARITEIQKEIADYRERQAGELVDREILREVEKRLLDEIRQMQMQLRDLYEKLIARGYPPS